MLPITEINAQKTFTRQQRSFFYGFILLLLVPALLINLGMLPFIDDEAIRALIALEMDLSGNYITPTINGEYYYNKPPLYNWFLLLWFKGFDSYTEFISRLATIFCLLGYATTIFYFSRKHYNTKFAFLSAFFLVTCGRILIYDSMLGLIDIAFSWVTFSAFMLVYHQYQKGDFRQLFAWTYLLTAIGFLMKGLPSLVFQAATLSTFFLYKKDLKKLFSLVHFFGISLFFIVVGSYYFIYNQYNSLGVVVETLLDESTKRTATQHGIGSTILHLFTFPFEVIYHFLPWTILVVLFFQKGVRQVLAKDEFIVFSLITFLANILVYWISVEVYPRYLFMHLPLLFMALLYLYFQRSEESKWHKFIHFILGSLCFGLFLAMFLPLFFEETQQASFLYFKVAVLSSIMGFLCWLFLEKKQERLLITIAVLLVARIAFNWFIIPNRLVIDWGTPVKESTVRIGQTYKYRPFFLHPNTLMQPTSSFYLTRERMEIFRLKESVDSPKELFLINPFHNRDIEYDIQDSLKIRYKKLTFDVADKVRKIR